jgi:hypothetical protein
MSEQEIEENIREAMRHLIAMGQASMKKGCFISKVCVVSHGGFVRQIVQNEYWTRARKHVSPNDTAPIPLDSTVPVNSRIPIAN